MKLLQLVLSTALILLSFAAQATEQSSEQAYQRCAACHMSDGGGVPGVFPPLNKRIAAIADSREGRQYLTMVVQAGLMGSIDVQGVSYFGVMPAQGSLYDAKGIAAVLNYVVETLGQKPLLPTWKAFSAEEVEQTLVKNEDKLNGQHTARRRRELFLKYPELNEMVP